MKNAYFKMVSFMIRKSNEVNVEKNECNAFTVTYRGKTISKEKLRCNWSIKLKPGQFNKNVKKLQDIDIPAFNVKISLCLQYIADFFMLHDNIYDLSNSDLSVPCFKTVANGKRSIKHWGPQIWAKIV